MGDIGLTHRADCHANGVAAQYAAAVKGELEPIFLCYHHTSTLTSALEGNGWQVVLLTADSDTKAVRA